MENADLIRSDTDTDIWQRSPFEQCPGEFWNPADPTQRYAGTFRLEMGLPFVEIPRLDHTRLDWETGILYGIFSDSREVIMIAHEDRKYPVSVYRGDIEFYRYQGLHALIGEQAVGFYAETTLQKVTLVVQPISNWMSRDNSAKTQIGSGFYKPTEVPRITACVESEPRLLTIDLGEEKPLKSALTILDEAQYLARRAIGCLSGKPPVARNYTVQTVSGLTFEWHFARWEAPMREPISTDMRMYLSDLGPTETLLNRFATVEQDLRPPYEGTVWCYAHRQHLC